MWLARQSILEQRNRHFKLPEKARRQRSDATATITAATQQQLIDAILLERLIEFLGEGLRNNDLMRLLQTIPAKGAASTKITY